MKDTVITVAQQPASLSNNTDSGHTATVSQGKTPSPLLCLLSAPAHEVIVWFGHFMFRFRNALFPFTLVLLVLTSTPQLPFASARLDLWLDVVGVMLAFIGQTCGALAIGSVDNIRRGGRRKRIAAETLIRSGIYAHTRNPLYLGNLIIVSGLLLIANCRLRYLLVWPGFLGSYYAIVRAEEDFLTRKFAWVYRDYLRTVNRFMPTHAGLCQSLARSSFAWRRVCRKEFGIVCSWLASALVLLLWKQWEHEGTLVWKAHLPYGLFSLLALLGLVHGMVWLYRSHTRKAA